MRRTFRVKFTGRIIVSGTAIRIKRRSGLIRHITHPVLIKAAAATLMVIQGSPTVSAVHQPGQRIRGFIFMLHPFSFAQLLHQPPGFLVDNGLLRILKYHPILRCIKLPLFILIAVLVTAKIYRIPQIFRLGQNIRNRGTAPGVRSNYLLFVFPHTKTQLRQMVTWPGDFILSQNPGYLLRSIPLNRQPKNPAHHRRRFFINNPAVFILWIFYIAIDRHIG